MYVSLSRILSLVYVAAMVTEILIVLQQSSTRSRPKEKMFLGDCVATLCEVLIVVLDYIFFSSLFPLPFVEKILRNYSRSFVNSRNVHAFAALQISKVCVNLTRVING